VTPPPLPVPEGVGPILHFEQPGDGGTSDSEGDERDDSEGAPENEGVPPDATARAAPPAAPPTVESVNTTAKKRTPIC
jgi:hypothetical protein